MHRKQFCLLNHVESVSGMHITPCTYQTVLLLLASYSSHSDQPFNNIIFSPYSSMRCLDYTTSEYYHISTNVHSVTDFIIRILTIFKSTYI